MGIYWDNGKEMLRFRIWGFRVWSVRFVGSLKKTEASLKEGFHDKAFIIW